MTANQATAANDPAAPIRALPAVAALTALARRQGSGLADAVLTAAVQTALADERAAILAGARPRRDEIAARVLATVAALEQPRLRRAINATGVIVHTNLGRAAVSDETARAMAEAAVSPVALELEPERNERGGRMREIAALLAALTGTEAALAVNNCAAALLLTLSALASGREVVVSRGEAVEIGGGFRIPDVLWQSGATLVEVGTTNRTYARDYADAIGERTAALLKVHASNFRVIGFVHAPALSEIVELGRDRGVFVVEDLGSGALLDTGRFGLAPEPMVQDSVGAGADVVLFSGDKLLGGPQAGVIVGRRLALDRIARHPLARAVRADKTCLAGLAATLRHYARGEAVATIPVWRAIAADTAVLERRASEVVSALASRGIPATSVPSEATIGGGSLPGQTLPSRAVALAVGDEAGNDLDGLARRLRVGPIGVFGRIERDRLLIDLRTVPPEADEELVALVAAARAGE